MADGRWQMADGRWQMADGRWQMADGRWQMAERSFPFSGPLLFFLCLCLVNYSIIPWFFFVISFLPFCHSSISFTLKQSLDLE